MMKKGLRVGFFVLLLALIKTATVQAEDSLGKVYDCGETLAEVYVFLDQSRLAQPNRLLSEGQILAGIKTYLGLMEASLPERKGIDILALRLLDKDRASESSEDIFAHFFSEFIENIGAKTAQPIESEVDYKEGRLMLGVYQGMQFRDGPEEHLKELVRKLSNHIGFSGEFLEFNEDIWTVTVRANKAMLASLLAHTEFTGIEED